ncbi:hypothetical protein F5B20DRAFT_594252 [Whalleya microplaca]|nr:hypothetical protein F5B20DRAFT_594252 [Whalleya microplaca]
MAKITAEDALEDPGVEWNFLDLERMRKLPVDSEERQRLIIRRSNYYMFSSSSLRGAGYQNPKEWDRRILSFKEADVLPEYLEPNQKLESPPEKIIEKYRDPKADKPEYAIDLPLIKNLVERALKYWDSQGNEKAEELKAALGRIPNPERIKKVDVELFAADPQYGNSHKVALQELDTVSFTILDEGYRKHQQFAIIDDNTFVISDTGPQCPVDKLLVEYARPVAMITPFVSGAPNKDVLWYEIEDEDTHEKVSIPGNPWFETTPERVKNMFENEYTKVNELSHEFEGNRFSEEIEDELLNHHGFVLFPEYSLWSGNTYMFIRND